MTTATPTNARVSEWNDVFLSTYEMCIDSYGYTHDDAMLSARINASDTIRLSPVERLEADDSDPRNRQ